MYCRGGFKTRPASECRVRATAELLYKRTGFKPAPTKTEIFKKPLLKIPSSEGCLKGGVGLRWMVATADDCCREPTPAYGHPSEEGIL